jgi:hypothetical protein
MHSTLTPKPSDDPHDIVVVAPDVVRVAPSDQEISHLLQQAARFHSEAQARAASDVSAGPTVPPVDTTFRPAAVDDVLGSPQRRSIGKRLARAFVALLLTAGIAAAAVGWQAFGYAGKKLIAKWMPQFALTTSLPLEKLWPSAHPAPPAEEADSANAESPQAASPAQAAAEAVAPAAAPSADSAQSLQSMARDLASVLQEVEQLKASIAELKASQQQTAMARDAAKVSDNKAAENRAFENRASELNARARLALAPPRPAVAHPRKPVPSYSPTQAAGAPPLPQAAAPYTPQAAAPQAGTPYAPRQAEPLPPAVEQLPAAPGFTSVPRPPMPVQ